MAKIFKEYQDLLLAFGLGIMLLVGGLLMMSGTIGLFNSASAATGTIEVTATVEETLTFNLYTTTTNLSPSLIDSSGNPHVGSSTNIVMDVYTNKSSYSISVSSTYGGLYNATATDDLIETVNPTSTLVGDGGSGDGYGLNATSTSSGEIESNYDYWGTLDVGEIPSSTSPYIIQDSTGVPGTATTTIKIYAECDLGQDEGAYNDTILLTALGGT